MAEKVIITGQMESSRIYFRAEKLDSLKTKKEKSKYFSKLCKRFKKFKH